MTTLRIEEQAANCGNICWVFHGGYEIASTCYSWGLAACEYSSLSSVFNWALCNAATYSDLPKALFILSNSIYRIKGEFTFWIISRDSTIADPEAVIRKIRKEPECQRVISALGSLAGSTGAFRFFKNHELHKLKIPNTEGLACNYANLCESLGNGDDLVFVKVSKTSLDRNLSMNYSYYVSCMQKSHFILAGNGDWYRWYYLYLSVTCNSYFQWQRSKLC